MSEALFIRLLPFEDKAQALAEAVSSISDGTALNSVVHAVDPDSFEQVPGSPFAYWVSERVRRLFKKFPVLRDVCFVDMGMSTKNDNRFVRLRWEVPPERIGWNAEFRLYAKGGNSEMEVLEIDTLIFSQNNFQELRQELIEKYPYLDGNTDWVLHPEYHYGQHGLTFGRRVRRFTVIPLPEGLMFSDSNPSIFSRDDKPPHWLGAYLSSNIIRSLLGLIAPPRKVEVGYVDSLPVPNDIPKTVKSRLAAHAIRKYRRAQELASRFETDPRFILPPKLSTDVNEVMSDQSAIDDEVDDLVCEALGLGINDKNILLNELAMVTGLSSDLVELEDDERENVNSDRGAFYKKTVESLFSDYISYSVGCALGRWDVRFANGERRPPELPDPFAPLPICAPGALTDAAGLPLRESPPGYPLRVDWEGLLVDDAAHESDVIRRVRELLQLLFKKGADETEREMCATLGVKSLRDYFRKPTAGGFWADHIKRYSKSRRKAPIYWLLRSSKGNYAIWLYYHRLDKDVLYKALLNYVEPKLRLEENNLSQLRQRRETVGTTGREAKQLEKELDKQESFISELHDFHGKLKRAADLHLEPDLNDGVVLNIAPLWELVPWTEAKKYWKELTEGKYEWSSISKQLRERGLVAQ